MEAKIWNVSAWVQITTPKKLYEFYHALLQDSGFHILGFIEHNFEPEGWTALWLLGESHLAIHTWPEEGKSYVELSSCNEEYFEEFLGGLEGYNVNIKITE